jgi:hypothetical protein
MEAFPLMSCHELYWPDKENLRIALMDGTLNGIQTTVDEEGLRDLEESPIFPKQFCLCTWKYSIHWMHAGV